MRISSSTINRYMTQDMMRYQIEIADLQSQISSGKKLEKPSDDPVNAARQVNLTQTHEQTEQYTRNLNIAEARLSEEETYLMNSENIMMRVRELALTTNNAATSPDSYPAIRTELEHLYAELVAQANATDSEGNFIFSGTKTSTKPFVPGEANIYRGDNQQRLIQVNPLIAMETSDTGDDIFVRIPASDQPHVVTSDAANTGGASILITTDGTTPNPGSDRYEIRFTAAKTYDIINLTSGTTEVTGGTLPPSNNIDFNGMQISLTGVAATNDAFYLEPTGQQDIFKTVEDFMTLLDQPPNNQAEGAINRQTMNQVLIGITQGFEHLTLKRSDIGTRLSALDNIAKENDAVSYQLEVTLSDIGDVDYTEAITSLQQKAVALEALQATITRTQSLSLFNS